ncbi:MAG TPA: SWIM zinc finger family protein [Actinomycetota bacterium]|nr:SWIM zinc finger family protein [Actinomycetota bacterium]
MSASVLAGLVELLSRFDDAAYEALASRGLVRRARKDLEKLQVTVVEEEVGDVVVAVGEHRVTMDARGPAHAKCSCPAGTVCQHILAAAMGLSRAGVAAPAEPDAAEADQESGPQPPAQPAGAPPAPAEPDPVAVLRGELLGIDAPALKKHAGVAGYRWAWQFVQDLDPEAVEISGDRNLVVRFTRPRMTFRYPGGGVENLILDTKLADPRKYRVAAVLAFQAANGVAITAPDPPRTSPQALDLGKDHAVTSGEATQDARVRLLAAARRLIAESVELGLSHLSPGIEQRYSTLAVWSQGVGFHRLALILRRIADHVELLLERTGGADEHRLLNELAIAFGLVRALEAAAARGAEPAHLMGRSRSRYDEAGTLDLIGVGAMPWRSASGYVGLTMVFWSSADRSFFTCTDARPETMRGWDPVARYLAEGPWSGLGSPAEATGRLVTLTGAQMNDAGRLSAASGISAIVRELPPDSSLTELLDQYSNWADLTRDRAKLRRSLLAEPEPVKDWVALAPSEIGPARFDAARQTLVLPLLDGAGERISCELAYSDLTAHAIGRLEEMAAQPLAKGTVFVVRVRGSRGTLAAEPLSVVLPEGGDRKVDALHFDDAPKRRQVSRLLSRLRPAAPAHVPAGLPPTPRPAILPAITELKTWLQGQAERGVAEDFDAHAASHLRARLDRASADGLTALPGGEGPGPSSERLLAAHYVCMQYERLIDDAV